MSVTSVSRTEDPVTGRPIFRAFNVQREQGFAEDLLNGSAEPYVQYDGQRIVLEVDNGRWVWEVVGRDTEHRIVFGRWPD